MDRPTWSWVGFSLYRELSKYYAVKVFREGEQPAADVIVSIKEPFRASLPSKTPVVYVPCDYYSSYEQLLGDDCLRESKAIVCHSESLTALMRTLHHNVHLMDHDSKYFLPRISEYRSEGPILWIGFKRYLRVFRRWLLNNPLKGQLVVLTDKPGELNLPGNSTQLLWTPRRQQELLQIAKAAIDIKGSDFEQQMKPPEKLQIFIASGIPSACNRTSRVFAHFKNDGFDIVSPSDPERWFSREYHAETCRYAATLRRQMSPESIGMRMKEIIDSLL